MTQFYPETVNHHPVHAIHNKKKAACFISSSQEVPDKQNPSITGLHNHQGVCPKPALPVRDMPSGGCTQGKAQLRTPDKTCNQATMPPLYDSRRAA